MNERATDVAQSISNQINQFGHGGVLPPQAATARTAGASRTGIIHKHAAEILAKIHELNLAISACVPTMFTMEFPEAPEEEDSALVKEVRAELNCETVAGDMRHCVIEIIKRHEREGEK